jgi:hypothetical protein
MGLLTQVSPVDLHLSYEGSSPYGGRGMLLWAARKAADQRSLRLWK